MALLLSFPARAPTANRTAQADAASADIIILPCIRRERIDVEQVAYASRSDELQTQRQA